MSTEARSYIIVANLARGEKSVAWTESEASAKRAIEIVASERKKGRKLEASLHDAANLERAVEEAERLYPGYHCLGRVSDVLKVMESDPR
jgi:hypothetical protein